MEIRKRKEETVYPIVEQYVAAVKQAQHEYSKRYTVNNEELNKKTSQVNFRVLPYGERDRMYSEYYAENDKASDDKYRALEAAWELLGTSDDPMVRFIYEHCDEYEGHARQILEILPADFPAMRDVARRGGWCEVFDKFAAKAVQAKVITEDRSPARRKLEKHLQEQGMHGLVLQETLDLVNMDVATAVRRALVAERKAVRLAKKSTAKTKLKSDVAVTA